MIKHLIIAAFVSAGAFLFGLVSVYFAMPSVAPEVVAETQQRLGPLAPFSPAAGDSLLLPNAPFRTTPDSVLIAQARAEVENTLGQALQDSMQAQHDRLSEAETRADELRDQMEALREEIGALELKRMQVVSLSSTLTRLEEDELSDIVRQLDPGVLRLLYESASGRKRTRLLQAMSADQAAAFVENVVVAPTSARDRANVATH